MSRESFSCTIRGTFMSPGYTFMLKIQYYKINSLVISNYIYCTTKKCYTLKSISFPFLKMFSSLIFGYSGLVPNPDFKTGLL